MKELVLTGILMSARNVSSAIAWTKTLKSDISKTVEKNKSQFAGHEIKGKVLGVIGLGAIGVMVANAAESLGMHVIGYDPYMSVQSAHELSRTVEVNESLDLVLPKCDYITIHVPFMENTKELINEKRFNIMKDGVCLLNFSRDQIVSEADLLNALESGKVRKYVRTFHRRSSFAMKKPPASSPWSFHKRVGRKLCKNGCRSDDGLPGKRKHH